MAAGTVLVQEKGAEGFVLNVPRSAVAKIHFADVDLVIVTTDGTHYVLPGAAIAAMESKPPKVSFSDSATTADLLLSSVGVVDDPTLNTLTKTSEVPEEEKPEPQDAKKIQEELDEAKEKVEELKAKLEEKQKENENAEEQAKELEEAKDQIEAQDQLAQEKEVLAAEKEAAEALAEKLQKITEQLHNKDFDYTPPQEYQPPPAPFTGPAGVPAPISMTPLVLLTMGNVVGTVVSGVNIYGGGGETGSDAAAKLGPRDALQFSTATITGTAGNDVIYAEGPLVGNPNPAADTSMYAKQFLLRIAGYFTELDDIVFKGLPSSVTVTNATLRGDGAWVLPSAFVVSQQAFELVYDKDAWRADGNDIVDMTIEVSGMMRSTSFTSSEVFRFQFMDVTEASQSTNPYLTFWDDGQNKQIYVLPTQDQPNIITADAGDDMIYGGRNHDTIDAGDGNDQVWAYGGNNNVTGGAGDDAITTGDDNDTISGGDDNDTIIAGAGTNVINTGEGTNSVTAGAGNDTVTGGTGDDTIDVGNGTNIVNAGAGANTITTGTGADTITSGAGLDIIIAGDGLNNINAGDGDNQITTGVNNDLITVGAGNNTINAGDGANTITTGDGNNTITTGTGVDTVTLGTGTNSVFAGAGNDFLYGGAGDDTLQGEDGDDLLRGGLGTNVIVGGAGINTADYTGLGVGVTASLVAETAVGVGIADTLTGIQNIIGSANDDIITGTAGDNVLAGAAGNDTITGGGGTDTITGGDGDDLLTGGAGVDTISGGAGADTINGGGAGADILSGGDGDDIFINPSIGTTYDGGAGIDKVDYSAQVVSMIVDLAAGTGYSGTAYLASYTGIEWIVTGSAADTLTGGSGNDILDGGAGNDTFSGGSGTNTLIGGNGSNYYNMGVGIDFINASVGQWDEVRYQGSPVGIVVNLDSVEHSFVNTLGNTITVNALSGSSRQESIDDTASWSLGDTYSAGGVDYIHASNRNDVLFGSAGNDRFYGWDGNDDIYSGGGDDFLYMSAHNDRLDAEAGTDLFYTHVGNNITAYLDGTVDTNSNGIADYIDRGQTAIFGGSGYMGFAYGWSGTTLISNFENLLGASGGDTLVGNANNNEINGQTGANIVFGLGGDDIIFAHLGSNAIDGGTGTDTISFCNLNINVANTQTGAYGYNSGTIAEIYLADADLDGNGVMDRAGTWGAYTGFTARTNLAGTYSYNIVTNVENIVGTINADKLAGDANANIIRGYNGNDLISGNGGADTLYGDGNDDTFVVASSDLAAITEINGGANVDTLRASGWVYSAGNIYASNSKYANIETVDTRNLSAGDAYGLNAFDIQSMVDAGNASVLSIKLDTGDTFTYQIGAGTGALSCLQTTDTATDDVYKFYSDAGHVVNNSTNLVGILNVHYGA